MGRNLSKDRWNIKLDHRAQLFGKDKDIRHIYFCSIYIHIYEIWICMYAGSERGEMKPGLLTSVEPPPYSESHINI
jgi:hypothetical protein